jgi:hypothetical protein
LHWALRFQYVQKHNDLRGSSAFELRRVELVLAQLARPVLEEDSVGAATRDALLQLGIRVGGEASRRDLIERVWGRKRALLRQVSAMDDWGPLQPVA